MRLKRKSTGISGEIQSCYIIRNQRKHGVTRKEVLLCLALAFLLFSVVRHHVLIALSTAGATRFLSNGRGIYRHIAQTHEGYSGLGEVYWLPDHMNPEHKNSSTGYFRYLMREDVGILHPDFGLFICSETRMESASNLGEFSSEYNAWAAVSGQNFATSHPTSPLFISRNLNEDALQDWQGQENLRLERIGRKAGANGWRTPYEHHQVVLIRMGGGGEVLRRKKGLLWKHLNPHSETNRILQP